MSAQLFAPFYAGKIGPGTSVAPPVPQISETKGIGVGILQKSEPSKSISLVTGISISPSVILPAIGPTISNNPPSGSLIQPNQIKTSGGTPLNLTQRYQPVVQPGSISLLAGSIPQINSSTPSPTILPALNKPLSFAQNTSQPIAQSISRNSQLVSDGLTFPSILTLSSTPSSSIQNPLSNGSNILPMSVNPVSPSSLVIPMGNLSINGGAASPSYSEINNQFSQIPQTFLTSQSSLPYPQAGFSLVPASLIPSSPSSIMSPISISMSPGALPINSLQATMSQGTPLSLTPIFPISNRTRVGPVRGAIPLTSTSRNALPLNLRKRGIVMVPDPNDPVEFRRLDPVVLQPISDAPEENIEVIQTMANLEEAKVPFRVEILARKDLTREVVSLSSVMQITKFFEYPEDYFRRFATLPFHQVIRKELTGRLYNYIPNTDQENQDLQQIIQDLETIFQIRVSKVQAILLRDGSDHISWQTFVRSDHIYITTFGSTRRYKLKSNKQKTVRDFEMSAGDLLYLTPETNQSHINAVASTKQFKGPHISLIFFATAPYAVVGKDDILSPNTLRHIESTVGGMNSGQLKETSLMLQGIQQAIN